MDGNQIDAQILPAGSPSLQSCVFSWDAENRLIAVKDASNNVLVSYHYDAQSRRISRSVGVSPTSSTLYLYDSWNCIAEYQQDGSGHASKRSYLWGMDLSGGMQGAGGVGGLLAISEISNLTSEIYYPTFDGNGNVSEYLDSTGAIVAHYEYDPFGKEVVSNGINANNFAYRFSTKPVDSATGLLYYGYRWIDLLTGRWPSRDPIGERGGVNLYGFVANNGVLSIDYLGMLYEYPGRPKGGHFPTPPPAPPAQPQRGIICHCILEAKCTPRQPLDGEFEPCPAGDCPTVTAEGKGGPHLNIFDSLGRAKNELWDDGDKKCGDKCTFSKMAEDGDCVCGLN